jgi:poly(A) polymerase
VTALDRSGLGGLLHRPGLRRLLELLNRDGEEARIVGGAVRNALLGHPVTEIDVTTTATPDVTAARATQAGLRAVPTGIEHGTITVLAEGEPFEVTSLREDVETNGRYAVVRFGRDFAADARRRDFTINALSLGFDGTLHDYVGGEADLAARRVRFIGTAANRIREDYLRILRFFRFHAEYGEGDLDPEGFSASVAARHNLVRLSRERIRTELLKLIAARHARHVVCALYDSGLYGILVGGVPELGRLARAAAVEAAGGTAPDPVRRLAALAVMTEEDVERLRELLRLSNDQHRRLSAYARLLAAAKTWPLPLDQLGVRRLVAEHGVEPLVDVLGVLRGEPRPAVDPVAYEALERFRTGADAVPVFPLKGSDLMARGIPAGPRMGEILDEARRAWIAAGCPEQAGWAGDLLERVVEKAKA